MTVPRAISIHNLLSLIQLLIGSQNIQGVGGGEEVGRPTTECGLVGTRLVNVYVFFHFNSEKDENSTYISLVNQDS